MKISDFGGTLFLLIFLLQGFANGETSVGKPASWPVRSNDGPIGDYVITTETDLALRFLKRFSESLARMPLYGPSLAEFVDRVQGFLTALEIRTNYSLGRFLEGLLPCQITAEGTFECLGAKKHGGVRRMIIDDVAAWPPILRPIAQICLNAVILPRLYSFLDTIGYQ